MKLDRQEWWKLAKLHVFAGVCAGIICIIQCVLDVAGVGKEYTLLCAGCGFDVFGFPHPNGLAIEPQFMGNLLIAPAFLSLLFTYNAIKSKYRKGRVLCSTLLSFLIIMSLYICFSRGAIYAFILALIFFVFYQPVWKKPLFMRVMIFFGISGLAFVGAILFQGVMAEFSTTSEGFAQGIARSIHQISLGKIDLRQKDETEMPTEKTEEKEEAIFNGYIEESTDIRLNLNEMALETWKDAPVFGVGLGGAGVALNQKYNYYAKEIIQNQFLSILLETGVVGSICLLLTFTGVIMCARRLRAGIAFWTCAIAYIITINFFSGLPNALHIYLISPMLMRLGDKTKYDKL